MSEGGGERVATTPTTSDGEMYPMTIPATEPIIMSATQSLQEYAAANGKHPRTVKEWLAQGLLPGAVQDPDTKRWQIPVGAVRTAPQQQALSRPAAPRTEVTAAPRSATIDWNDAPAFLTLEQAVGLLKPITAYAITSDPDYFGAVKKGEHGAWLVPLATVLRFRGLIP